jgi:hypothetical protein
MNHWFSWKITRGSFLGCSLTFKVFVELVLVGFQKMGTIGYVHI